MKFGIKILPLLFALVMIAVPIYSADLSSGDSTVHGSGETATSITDGIIVEADINANSPTDEYCLTYEVTGSPDLVWQSCGSGSVEDDVYGIGWDSDTTNAPSQNAVYDKIELLAPLSSPTLVTPTLGTIASGVGTTLTALDGENIQNDTIDDDSIDFVDVTCVDLTVSDCTAITTPTVDTGQGANELYDMDQNVLTTSDPTFSSITASPSADPRTYYNVVTATDTDWWTGVNDDAGSDDDDCYEIRTNTTPGSEVMLSVCPDGGVKIPSSATMPACTEALQGNIAYDSDGVEGFCGCVSGSWVAMTGSPDCA